MWGVQKRILYFSAQHMGVQSDGEHCSLYVCKENVNTFLLKASVGMNDNCN